MRWFVLSVVLGGKIRVPVPTARPEKEWGIEKGRGMIDSWYVVHGFIPVMDHLVREQPGIKSVMRND